MGDATGGSSRLGHWPAARLSRVTLRVLRHGLFRPRSRLNHTVEHPIPVKGRIGFRPERFVAEHRYERLRRL